MLFVVIYENLSVESNYDLIDKIKSFGEWRCITSNVWFVVNDTLTASEIKADLKIFLKNLNQERLMVMEIPNSVNYSGWMPKSLWYWMNKNLKVKL